MINQQFKNKWRTVFHFFYSRYLLNFKRRAQLVTWQQKKLKFFIKNVTPKSPFYEAFQTQNLTDYPLMDKALMLDNFSAINTQNISKEQAMLVASKAEVSRNFKPTLGNLTVGMSSGTSGKAGLFLVSDTERSKWAGILLAKTLPNKFLLHILQWWKPALSIAFFLRANSNLYNTLNSRRIDFRFYDLLKGVDSQVDTLNKNPPDALVAPPTVLHRLAQLALSGELQIQPQHIISVAEVLEVDDQKLIESAFSQTVHQIYQATEGFLGYTCEQGNLHLNESHIYIEKQWLDEQQKRFQPIITDFSRVTQLVIRYQLNDILRIADHACACGRVETCIAEIEGRADQILWLPSHNNANSIALYPDVLRRAMMLVSPILTQYSIIQDAMIWQVDIQTKGDRYQAKQAVIAAITNCCQNLGVQQPILKFGEWKTLALGVKRRRIWCNKKC
jgi:putative adenylate-forming enzyme